MAKRKPRGGRGGRNRSSRLANPPRRGARSGRKHSKRKAAPKKAARVEKHPLYGEIPLVTVTYKDWQGRESSYVDYDRSWRPPVPHGAVAGNVQEQEFCPIRQVPKYFYVDEEKRCAQCGEDFVFSGKEQKFWYESLKFPFDSVAIRCPRCRRLRRSERALRQQIAAALACLEEKPDDVSHLLALAESTVRYHRLTGEGNLDRALAAARRSAKAWPESREPLFWEAACQAEAGRRAKAEELFARFLEKRSRSGRHRRLAREAREYLGE